MAATTYMTGMFVKLSEDIGTAFANRVGRIVKVDTATIDVEPVDDWNGGQILRIEKGLVFPYSGSLPIGYPGRN